MSKIWMDGGVSELRFLGIPCFLQKMTNSSKSCFFEISKKTKKRKGVTKFWSVHVARTPFSQNPEFGRFAKNSICKNRNLVNPVPRKKRREGRGYLIYASTQNFATKKSVKNVSCSCKKTCLANKKIVHKF